MAGVDIRTVQELMGHHSIAMTLRYSHLSPAHQLDAVQKLNAATGTTTGTSAEPSRSPERPAQQVVGNSQRIGGRCRARTCDPRRVKPMLFQLS